MVMNHGERFPGTGRRGFPTFGPGSLCPSIPGPTKRRGIVSGHKPGRSSP